MTIANLFPSVIFNLTFLCPVECPYCFRQHSTRTKDTMAKKFAFRTIDELIKLDLGTKYILFSGGEPFMKRNLLREVTRYAASHNIAPQVVTSGNWATSFRVTVSILKTLQKDGLNVL